MERIFNLLDKIRDNYGVYIGKKSLHDISVLISGYECAIHDITGERILFDSTFQLYIEMKLESKYYNGKHWDGILLEKYGEDEAFEQFYVYLESFKELYINVNGKCLYDVLFSLQLRTK